MNKERRGRRTRRIKKLVDPQVKKQRWARSLYLAAPPRKKAKVVVLAKMVSQEKKPRSL